MPTPIGIWKLPWLPAHLWHRSRQSNEIKNFAFLDRNTVIAMASRMEFVVSTEPYDDIIENTPIPSSWGNEETHWSWSSRRQLKNGHVKCEEHHATRHSQLSKSSKGSLTHRWSWNQVMISYRRLSDMTATLEQMTPGQTLIHLLTTMGKIDELARVIYRSSALFRIASGKRLTIGNTVLPKSRAVTTMGPSKSRQMDQTSPGPDKIGNVYMLDFISVIRALSAFILSCNTNSVHEAAAVQLLLFYENPPTAATLNAHITLRSELYSRQKMGTETSYCEAVNLLLETFAKNEEIVKTDADMMWFTHTSSKPPTEYAEVLWNKVLQCRWV